MEKEMALHTSILAWKFHGQKSQVGYSPWGRERVSERIGTKEVSPSLFFIGQKY